MNHHTMADRKSHVMHQICEESIAAAYKDRINNIIYTYQNNNNDLSSHAQELK